MWEAELAARRAASAAEGNHDRPLRKRVHHFVDRARAASKHDVDRAHCAENRAAFVIGCAGLHRNSVPNISRISTARLEMIRRRGSVSPVPSRDQLHRPPPPLASRDKRDALFPEHCAERHCVLLRAALNRLFFAEKSEVRRPDESNATWHSDSGRGFGCSSGRGCASGNCGSGTLASVHLPFCLADLLINVIPDLLESFG